MDLALKNLQRLICHKNQKNQTKRNYPQQIQRNNVFDAENPNRTDERKNIIHLISEVYFSQEKTCKRTSGTDELLYTDKYLQAGQN